MPIAVLENPRSPATPHATIVDALESGADHDAPLATFHGSATPVTQGAWTTREHARAWARLFVHHGVRRGDRVVVLLPTGPAFVGALLGAMLAGAAAVPLATPLTFGSLEPFLRNLGAILENAEARVLVASPRVLASLREHGSALAVPKVVLTEADRETQSVTAVLPTVDACDTALIQYTSGTTGRPKGVMISHAALVANAAAIASGLELDASDVGVSWLPLFHDMGLVGVLLTAVCHPYPLHLVGPEHFAMGAERWMRLAAKVKATITAAPNFAYEQCATRADKLDHQRLESLRLALNGAEPVHASTIRRFEGALERHGLRSGASLPVYGMAECTLAVSFSERGRPSFLQVDREKLERDGVVARATTGRELVSVGSPVAGTSIRIADREDRTVETGVVGRIMIKSASLMDGYFRDDEASARALRDGWLDSGDLGVIAEANDGAPQLFVTGRAKELIIQGGRNIHPHDLERAAEGATALRSGSIVAFGAPDEVSGTERVILVVETTERGAENKDERARSLRGAVLATLGVRVDEVRFVRLGAIPRTTSGKARRGECARRFAEGWGA